MAAAARPGTLPAIAISTPSRDRGEHAGSWTPNYFVVPLQEALAEKLCALSGLHRVFFCNSGLEANEAALKIARRYGHSRGIERARIIVFEGAFHGRSIATLSASGNAKVHAGFGPLLDGFVRLPLNDTQTLQAAASHDDIVAVLLEPIQGEGGIRRVEDAHLRAIAAQCRANGWLLMLDEVQGGMGRTGRWFAHQRPAVDADVVLLAKGLASDVPIGAVLCSERAAAVMGPGSHGSTFGGNPLAMRAALETIAVIEEEDLLSRVRLVGHIIREQLVYRMAT
jgi:acetylornithine/N-succinyldiaminopimelate aminotransferase